MSIPSPPQALLRLTRKAVSLLGNGVNKYIFWQLPQCNITSNPYGGATGTYGLLNCIAIQNGAVSAVIWFYLPSSPPGQTGALLSIQQFAQYPLMPGAYLGNYRPWLYVSGGYLYATECCPLVQVSTPISPGWHMAVVVEWAASTSGPYYLALYLDGNFVGQTQNGAAMLFGGPYYFNDVGAGFYGTSFQFFNGYIAYIALYNRVLSPSEIMSIYQGNRVTNGLVAEYSGDTYDPSSGVWFDDVGGNNANLVLPYPVELIDLMIPTEFTSGINYDLLAQKIAEKIATKPINVGNLPFDQYSNIYIDFSGIANNPIKNWFNVLSNATITSNSSSSNYSAGPYRNFLVTIYVGSVSGTSPSLTVYFNAYDQYSGQSISMASVTLTSAGGTYIYVHDFPGNQFNISWVVGGTSPSFGSVYISVYESW